MNTGRLRNRHLIAAAVAALLSPAALAIDFTWLAGNYGPAIGPNPLQVGDVLRGQGDADKNFDAIAFTNQGTVTWQTASRIGFISAVVTNDGLWDLQADTALRYAGGGASNFINNGSFRKSAGDGSAVVGLGVQFINHGTVDTQRGTLDFVGGSATFNAGTQFTGAGVTRISSNASFAGAFQATNLLLASGSFAGDNTTPAVLGGSVRWTGGQFTGSWQVASVQTLSSQDGGDKNFNAVQFTNRGTVAWQGVDRLGFISSTVENAGLWDMQADASLLYAGGGASQFINSGSFRKSAGSGSVAIGQGVAFINTGIVDAQSGTIDFAGGSASFLAGSRFIGGGVNRIGGNASFAGSFHSENLVFAAGNFAGDNTTPALLNGQAHWTGGQFAGAWQVGSGQTLLVQDGADKNFSAASFTNSGTVAWQGADRAGFISSTVANQGLWDMQADAGLLYAGGGGSQFINSGIFRKSAGSGSAAIGQSVAFINSGLVDAQSGTIDFAGGGAQFQAGTRFAGGGVNRISSNAGFAGSFSSENLVFAAGSFAGDNGNPAVLNGQARWTGGQFTGTWQIAAGQTLLVQDGADKNFAATSFTNSGTVAWQGADRAGLISSTVANQGLWDVQADAGLLYAAGGGSQFINSGVFRKSAGSGSAAIGIGVAFINTGVVDAQSGTIDFAGGGAQFQAGTRFVGAGVNRIGSNASFAGGFSSENLVFAAGSFAGDNTTPAVLSGQARWTGGQFTGTWQIGSGQTLTALGGTDKNFNATSFTNHGSVAWQGDDRIGFVSAAVVNAGLFDIQGDADLAYAGGGGSSFVNSGTLRKSAGDGTTAISASVAFSNPGTIEALSGTLQLPANFVNPGTVRGTATVQTNLLSNAGHVAPGASASAPPATLTIAGNFAQAATGVLDIDLHTLASSDLLRVYGTAALDGTLALHCQAACSLAIGDEVLILDATDLMGTAFAAEPTLSGFASGQFDLVYDRPNGDVWLRVTETVTAVPEPGTWLLMLGGLSLLLRRTARPRA